MVFEFSWQIGAGENSQIPVKSSTIHSPSNDTIFVSGNDEPRLLNCAGAGTNHDAQGRDPNEPPEEEESKTPPEDGDSNKSPEEGQQPSDKAWDSFILETDLFM